MKTNTETSRPSNNTRSSGARARAERTRKRPPADSRNRRRAFTKPQKNRNARTADSELARTLSKHATGTTAREAAIAWAQRQLLEEHGQRAAQQSHEAALHEASAPEMTDGTWVQAPGHTPVTNADLAHPAQPLPHDSSRWEQARSAAMAQAVGEGWVNHMSVGYQRGMGHRVHMALSLGNTNEVEVSVQEQGDGTIRTTISSPWQQAQAAERLAARIQRRLDDNPNDNPNDGDSSKIDSGHGERLVSVEWV